MFSSFENCSLLRYCRTRSGLMSPSPSFAAPCGLTRNDDAAALPSDPVGREEERSNRGQPRRRGNSFDSERAVRRRNTRASLQRASLQHAPRPIPALGPPFLPHPRVGSFGAVQAGRSHPCNKRSFSSTFPPWLSLFLLFSRGCLAPSRPWELDLQRTVPRFGETLPRGAWQAKAAGTAPPLLNCPLRRG